MHDILIIKMTNDLLDDFRDNFRNFGMVVYSSPSVIFTVISHHNALMFRWQPAAISLPESEVRNEFMRAVPYIRDHMLTKMIIDERLYPFLEHFELQSWFEFEAIPAFSAAGVLYLALLVPPNKIAELKEQRVESFNDPVVSYLSEESEVTTWLQGLEA